MNAYWMNEMIYEGVTCPVWLAIVLGVVVLGFIGAMIYVIRKTWIW